MPVRTADPGELGRTEARLLVARATSSGLPPPTARLAQAIVAMEHQLPTAVPDVASESTRSFLAAVGVQLSARGTFETTVDWLSDRADMTPTNHRLDVLTTWSVRLPEPSASIARLGALRFAPLRALRQFDALGPSWTTVPAELRVDLHEALHAAIIATGHQRLDRGDVELVTPTECDMLREVGSRHRPETLIERVVDWARPIQAASRGSPTSSRVVHDAVGMLVELSAWAPASHAELDLVAGVVLRASLAHIGSGPELSGLIDVLSRFRDADRSGGWIDAMSDAGRFRRHVGERSDRRSILTVLLETVEFARVDGVFGRRWGGLLACRPPAAIELLEQEWRELVLGA